MEGILFFKAIFTISSGVMSSPQFTLAVNSSAWEISQFWQARHLKLHPIAARDKDSEPGRK